MVAEGMQRPAEPHGPSPHRMPRRCRPTPGPSGQPETQPRVSQPAHGICLPLEEKLHQQARAPAGVRLEVFFPAWLHFCSVKTLTQGRDLPF